MNSSNSPTRSIIRRVAAASALPLKPLGSVGSAVAHKLNPALPMASISAGVVAIPAALMLRPGSGLLVLAEWGIAALLVREGVHLRRERAEAKRKGADLG